MPYTTTDRTYQSGDWRHQLFSVGKYLIPKSAFLIFDKGIAAPQSFVRLEQVATPSQAIAPPLSTGKESDSASITYRVATQGAGHMAGTVPYFFGGERTQLPLPAIADPPNSLYRIPGGYSVGRNGCLMDAQQNAILETAFLYKPGLGTKTYKAFDPRHWKHIRHGNLTARKRLPSPFWLSGVSMALNNCSCHNFFHWMTEVAPRLISAKLLGISVDHYLVDHRASYQKQVLEMLGTKPEQWVQPHCDLNLQCEVLLWSNEPNAGLLNAFASTIKQAIHLNQPGGRKIYITRRSAHHRKLRNEASIIDSLSKRNFEVHDFDAMSFADQAKLMGQVSQVVAVHGAALANTIFAPPKTKIVEIVPKKRNNYYLYPNQSRMFGFDHAIAGAESTHYRQWLSCDLTDLNHALDELEC